VPCCTAASHPSCRPRRGPRRRRSRASPAAAARFAAVEHRRSKLPPTGPSGCRSARPPPISVASPSAGHHDWGRPVPPVRLELDVGDDPCGFAFKSLRSFKLSVSFCVLVILHTNPRSIRFLHTDPMLTDKTRIHLRSASVRTYTFFTTGFPRFLSIRGARGLLALIQVLI
jgi:hypothetical protein